MQNSASCQVTWLPISSYSHVVMSGDMPVNSISTPFMLTSTYFTLYLAGWTPSSRHFLIHVVPTVDNQSAHNAANSCGYNSSHTTHLSSAISSSVALQPNTSRHCKEPNKKATQNTAQENIAAKRRKWWTVHGKCYQHLKICSSPCCELWQKSFDTNVSRYRMPPPKVFVLCGW